MNISVTELRAFVTVAEQGRITRAAEQLEVAQSSLSTCLRHLEEKLHVRLFDRHTRMLRLTAFGIEMLPVAKRILDDLELVARSSRDLVQLSRGKVTVAAPMVQAAIWLPPLIEQFLQRHPNVQVVLKDVPEQDVHSLVRSGAVDIGVATATETHAELAIRSFYTDSYVVVLHPDDALSRLQEVPWSHLAAMPLIGPPLESPSRSELDRRLGERGLTLKFDREVSLPWTMLGMVQSKLGVAIVTNAVRSVAESMGLAVRPLTSPCIARDVAAITSCEHSLSPSAERFHKMLLSQRMV